MIVAAVLMSLTFPPCIAPRRGLYTFEQHMLAYQQDPNACFLNPWDPIRDDAYLPPWPDRKWNADEDLIPPGWDDTESFYA